MELNLIFGQATLNKTKKEIFVREMQKLVQGNVQEFMAE